jgi:hypothetical protein
VTLRKNGGDTSDTVTIPATTTGEIQADWDTDFADGDLLSIEIELGGNGGQGLFTKGGTLELLTATE